MTLVLTCPNGQPRQIVDLCTLNNNQPVRAQLIETDLNSCTAVDGFTVAAMNAALATGAAEVCFPPGIYDVNGLVSSNTSNQVLTFQSGAVLLMSANGLGQLAINGDDSAIQGDPLVRFDASSAVAYVAVDLHGQGTSCGAIRFETNANISNATLLRVSGDSATVGEVTIEGVGSFAKGLELARQDGTAVLWVETGRVRCFLIDDGVTTRTYSSMIRLRCAQSRCGGIAINSGGRALISAVIDVDGTHNELVNPQILCSGADFGIRMNDNSEFLDVFGGEVKGGYKAGSQGVLCGLFGGQLKAFGLKITNWDIGVRFTGSCDAPSFFGCTIANNKVFQVEIDAQRGAAVWPISGLGFYGCYSEDVAFNGASFLHLKTGSLEGMTLSSCQIGYHTTAVLVEATFAANSGNFLGCRFAAAVGTDAVTTPNTFSSFWFATNAFFASNLISTGAFAARAEDIDNPVLVSLQTTTGTVRIGTAGDTYKRENFTFFTANFGAGIGAGAAVELDFAWAAANTNFILTFGVNGTLAANTSLTFDCFVRANGTATLRARNNTLVAVGAISGTVLFRSTSFI